MENIKRPSLFWFFTEGVRSLIEYVISWFFIKRFKFKQQGDGHPVLVVPGLLCTDFSTRVLRRFINRLGFTALSWELGRNLGELNDLKDLKRLNKRIDDIYNQYNTQITLIGWSMGGIYVREIAKQRPELFRQVITLGSPFSNVDAPNNAKWIYEWVTDTSGVDEAWRLQIPNPAPIRTTAVYTKQDGIVPWQACLERIVDEKHENREVRGSHWGLGMNKSVLRIVDEKLASY
jgi:pimeloyl-ACP methyl ester carboxylesterase